MTGPTTTASVAAPLKPVTIVSAKQAPVHQQAAANAAKMNAANKR